MGNSIDSNQIDDSPHVAAVAEKASSSKRSNFYDYLLDESRKFRNKRQADQYEYTPTKTRCPLLLVADYRFFQEMGSGNTKTTINYLVIKKLFEILN